MVPPVNRSRRRDRAGPGYGQRAFGHTRDRARLIDEEAAAIREAADRLLEGETATRIVEQWNRQGLRTTAGSPWRLNAFAALLTQPRLLGTDDEHGRPVSPAILDRATFDRLNARRQERNRGPRRAPTRYLLTGVLLCWRCGSRLCGMSKAGAEGVYTCQPPGHGGCSGTSIKAGVTVDALADLVRARVDSPEFAAGLKERVAWFEAHGDEPADSVAVVADGRHRLKELDEMWAAGEIDRARWSKMQAHLARTVRHHEERMAPRRDLQAQGDLRGMGEALQAWWPEMSPASRRRVIDLVLYHVVVLPARPRRLAYPAERLRPRWRV